MRHLTLFLASLTFGTLLLWADGSEPPEVRAEPWWLGPREEERLVFSIDRLTTVDPSGESLHGIRLMGGTWDEPVGDMLYGGRGLFWARYLEGRDQRTVGAGFDGGVILFPFGPGRLLVTFGLGLQHRGQPPQQGYEGVGDLGVEVAFWLGKKWNLGVSAERNFCFSSGTHNVVGFELRWAPKVTYQYGDGPKQPEAQ